jgi:Kef-type K+ transport system membrane component KefB
VNPEQLILSVGNILLAARALGWIFQRIGQPRVVGEMTAGIMLGPSLLGRFFPGAFGYIFPSSSLPVLTALSQLGLLLFMFVVGLEVDLKRVVKQRTAVVLISNVSIVLPLALGIGPGHSALSAICRNTGAIFFFRSLHGNGNEHHRFPGTCPNPERA